MELNSLTAISPLDGRYRGQTKNLSAYFSESALIRYRVLVEIEYFIALCELPLPQLKGIDKKLYEPMRNLYRNFTLEQASAVKRIEKITNHDVKAVEYFIKEHLDTLGLGELREFVHFGLTSQDINNTATPLLLRDAFKNEIEPLYAELLGKLKQFAIDWKDISMLAYTHGQPASPTRLGKEINVFTERLEKQYEYIKAVPFSAKFGGATGNLNAHHVAYPKTDWLKFANYFVDSTLGLKRSQYTTQIEHYDNLAAFCDGMKRVNTILIDLNRDMWTYISMNYFKQKIKEGEIGSSAMPHKVNPIDFENSEGNLGLANAVFEHLSAKLPVSRLQRDLTDSTVLRNLGVPLAHTVIALKSLIKGMDKLLLNKEAIARDLDENWAVVAEAIQTILRREGFPKPYEALKELTRTHTRITQESIRAFIETLPVEARVKEELKQISPDNYTGI
ncbi:MAG TPA: adenylosuccinate lyase [Bacteroidia bacterium]|jgi:adenylosuccinate lyase|nr:adenylosuccinate lyase [Bacteroidia bacterium]